MHLHDCLTCHRQLPVTDFYVRRSGPEKDKLRQPCKQCVRHYEQRYKQTPAGKASIARKNGTENAKQRTARYLKSETFRLTRMRYRQSEKSRIVRANSQRSEKGKEGYRKRRQRYNMSEKGRNASIKYHAQRRMLMKTAITFTSEEWRAILETFLHCCAYCGRSGLPLERDHILPISKGGQHIAANIAPACRPCNARKHVFIPAGII